MNTQRKVELVTDWGFTARNVQGSQYIRDIYNPEGYVEIWSPRNPDYIQFFNVDGTASHDYKIDWSLFI
jgi:hypothetical protein